MGKKVGEVEVSVVKVFRSLCEQLLLFDDLDGFLSRAQSYLRYIFPHIIVL